MDEAIRDIESITPYTQEQAGTQVPDGWLQLQLGDVATMSQGGTPRKNRPEYWDGLIPFVTGADLTEFRIGRRNARSFLTANGLHSGDTVVCEPGTLLLATRTAVGLAGIATEIMGASQDITCLVTSDRVDAGYLCRSLIRIAPSLQRLSRGTSIQGITREDATSLPILLPPLAEQRAIAAVLDAIDGAIERTEAAIAATEHLRDALLHELLTRGVPGWHTEWRYVPGLGTIPACWDTVQLGEVCNEIHRYPTYYNIEYVQEGVLEVRGELIEENGKLPKDPSLYRRISPELSSRFVRTQLKEGDFVLTVRGTVGKVGYVHERLAGANMTANLLRISSIRSKLSPTWLKYVLMGDQFQSKLQSIVTRTTIDTVTAPDVKALPVHLPDMEEQQAIAAALDGVDEAMEQARQERDGLQLLKVSAADALLTGRVRVP